MITLTKPGWPHANAVFLHSRKHSRKRPRTLSRWRIKTCACLREHYRGKICKKSWKFKAQNFLETESYPPSFWAANVFRKMRLPADLILHFTNDIFAPPKITIRNYSVTKEGCDVPPMKSLDWLNPNISGHLGVPNRKKEIFGSSEPKPVGAP